MTLMILTMHIAAGLLALAMAGVAIATPKGKTWHRRSGSVYVGAMFVVSLSTLWLVAVRPNAFLLAVGIFSFFLVFTGWRAARVRSGRPQLPDHVVGALMAIAGLAMLFKAVHGFTTTGGSQPGFWRCSAASACRWWLWTGVTGAGARLSVRSASQST